MFKKKYALDLDVDIADYNNATIVVIQLGFSLYCSIYGTIFNFNLQVIMFSATVCTYYEKTQNGFTY